MDANVENPDELLDSFQHFEQSFRTDHALLWWATLVAPFVVTVLLVIGIYVWAGPAYTARLIRVGLLTMFALGRFVILAGHSGEVSEIKGFLTSEQLFLLVTYLDWVMSTVVTFHLGFLFRMPIVGSRLSSLAADGRFILAQHPWMKRATALGLTAFVAFPLAATGSVGGAIFGRLLGLSRIATFSGTLVGSTIGNGLMYMGSELTNRYIDKQNPAVQYGGLVIILVVIVVIEYRHRLLKQRFLARERERQAVAASQRDVEPTHPPAAENGNCGP